MTSNEHDKVARAKRVDAMVRLARLPRAEAEVIDDMTVQAVMASLDALEASILECTEKQRPYVAAQAKMMLHANLGMLISIEQMLVEEGTFVIAMGGTPEQQGKHEPTMPKKDLG